MFNLSGLGFYCPFVYQNLTDSWRKIGGGSGSTNCDRNRDKFDGNSWFRFIEPAGRKIPITAPSKSSCGTHAVSWIEGDDPTSIGQSVNRKICFRWDSQCQWSITNIKVAACMGYNNQMFYLYQLKKPTACSLAYCAV